MRNSARMLSAGAELTLVHSQSSLDQLFQYLVLHRLESLPFHL